MIFQLLISYVHSIDPPSIPTLVVFSITSPIVRHGSDAAKTWPAFNARLQIWSAWAVKSTPFSPPMPSLKDFV
jgi:hypothetical protein